MRGQRLRPGIVTAAVVGLAVTAVQPVGFAAEAGAGDVDVTRFARAGGPVVTLVTGDRVVLDDRGGADVLLADGREKVGYTQYFEGDDVYVIPGDAAPLIADGTLDRRLFNVTRLAEVGYHDGARKDVPLLVSYEDASAEVRSRTLADGAAKRVRSLAAIDGAALRAAKTEATRFWDSVRPMLASGGDIEHLWLDAPVRATLAESVPQIGAPEVWQDGHTGEGVRVAVLDTGVDTAHPDLAGAVVETEDFTGSGSVADGHGHGTHVAGTIAGDGTASDGAGRGVAPDADLVVGKVLDDNGSGHESWVLAGMEWSASRARIVNMSLGNGISDDGTSPLAQAVNRLTEETGTLFVIAAGNSGPGESSVEAPGSADAALTVGAVTKDDDLAGFSSRGPRLGDHGIKPDLTAPGQDIVAARAQGTAMGEPVDDAYTTSSGTSMAAPHVAGAAALLAQRHTDWKADRLKTALTSSAAPNPELTVFEQGSGRVDVARAARQPVLASPANLGFGIVEWPRTDDEPISRTVTYTNISDKEVTLDLTGELTGSDGPAPSGMLTVEPATLTIPANGTAEAVVTMDTRKGGPDGRYSGAVTGTADEISVRTPLAVEQEIESYRLDLTVLDRNGESAKDTHAFFVSHSKPWSEGFLDEDGTVSLRLPKDTYYLGVQSGYLPGSETDHTTFVEPSFVMDRDRTLVLDARKSEPVDVTVDEPDAEIGRVELSYLMKTTAYPRAGMIIGGYGLRNTYVMPSETSHETFEFTVETEHARADGQGGFSGSPYAYHLRQSERGRVPSELAYRVHDDDLAEVRSVHTDAGFGTHGERELIAAPLPFSLTEYYTPGVSWTPQLWLRDAASGRSVYQQRTVTFERGQNDSLVWNVPMYGPAFPSGEGTSDWAGRDGDRMWFYLPLHSEQFPMAAGISDLDYGGMRLHRDGELIGESDYLGFNAFLVPPEPGEYTAQVVAERPSLTPLSRRVEAEWTFRSEHTEGDGVLPLLAVRFAPELGDDHVAKAGERVRVPVSVQRNGSGRAPALNALTVEVSFDEGQTWKPAPVRHANGGKAIMVTAPRGADDVSLRAVAVDDQGNRVEQTIIGAYRID
ncbi:subtilisin-like serine protease [Saccharomonospora xinjiangensis XJ-54]|uniref:Subtilisin-like serine protease n=1 Tax=Saccharomonospora xinjiangensis XJ-54 TaxID=882086 RepID=I0V804_9PSEU|nr:subtilisin-like serine protease [Saccharomonospora xinjiangensis XJ-54]